MIRILFLTVLLRSLSSMAEQQILTLEESIVIGIKGATNVLKAQQTSELSATTLLQAYFQFTPSVTAQSTFSFFKGTEFFTQSTPTTVNSYNYGPDYTLTANLNIFKGLSDYASAKSAFEKRNAANFTLTRVKQQIALDIAQSFLQVVLDDQIIAIAKSNLKTSRERQALLEEQTKVGVRNLADLYRQRAQTSADESYLIGSDNKRHTDLITLLEKLRLDLNQEYQLIDPNLEQPSLPKSAVDRYGNIQTTIESALINRSDLAASKRQFQAAKWATTAAYSGYYPQINFAVDLYGNGRYYDYLIVNGAPQTLGAMPSFGAQLGTNVSTTFGFSLSWALWDNFMTPLNVKKAKVAAFDARIDFEDNRRVVMGDIKQAYGDYQAAIEQLIATKKGVKAAIAAFELTQGRYEVGVSSFLDLLTSQSAQTQAEAAYAQSLVAFALQERTMDFVMGVTNVD